MTWATPASAFDIFDSEVTATFLAYPTLQIVEIGVRVKGEQDARLIEPVAGCPRRKLAHAIGDEVFQRNHAEKSRLADRTNELQTGDVDGPSIGTFATTSKPSLSSG